MSSMRGIEWHDPSAGEDAGVSRYGQPSGPRRRSWAGLIKNMRRGKQAGGAQRLSFRRKSLRNAFRWNGRKRFSRRSRGCAANTNRSWRPHARRSRQSVSGFTGQRDDYFARVEAEIVQLALAIAAKILHREAQVDPMLVAALVRIAVEKLREGSSVTVRVGASEGSRWKQYFASEVERDARAGGRGCGAQRSRLPAGDGAWDGELRIGYAIEGSRARILRSAGVEAGEAMNRSLLAPYMHYLGDGLDAALEGRI